MIPWKGGKKTVISIELQKRIMYLPIVNISVLFIYYYNALLMKLSTKTLLKGGLLALLFAAPIMAMQFVISQIAPGFSNFSGYLVIYLAPLAIDMELIHYQEKLGI